MSETKLPKGDEHVITMLGLYDLRCRCGCRFTDARRAANHTMIENEKQQANISFDKEKS